MERRNQGPLCAAAFSSYLAGCDRTASCSGFLLAPRASRRLHRPAAIELRRCRRARSICSSRSMIKRSAALFPWVLSPLRHPAPLHFAPLHPGACAAAASAIASRSYCEDMKVFLTRNGEAVPCSLGELEWLAQAPRGEALLRLVSLDSLDSLATCPAPICYLLCRCLHHRPHRGRHLHLQAQPAHHPHGQLGAALVPAVCPCLLRPALPLAVHAHPCHTTAPAGAPDDGGRPAAAAAGAHRPRAAGALLRAPACCPATLEAPAARMLGAIHSAANSPAADGLLPSSQRPEFIRCCRATIEGFHQQHGSSLASEPGPLELKLTVLLTWSRGGQQHDIWWHATPLGARPQPPIKVQVRWAALLGALLPVRAAPSARALAIAGLLLTALLPVVARPSEAPAPPFLPPLPHHAGARPAATPRPRTRSG